MPKIKIQIFPKYDPCCGETTCGCGDDSQIESLLRLIRSTLGEDVKIELYDYSTREKLHQATSALIPHLDELNFKKDEIEVTDVLRHISPAVAIKGRLVFKRSFPTLNDLRKVLVK